MANNAEHPVLIVAPLGQDARAIATALGAQGVVTHVCGELSECARKIGSDVGALVLTQEALHAADLSPMLEALRAQEPWSELPLIVLCSGGEARIAALLELTAAASGNVTVLERPIHAETLLRAVEVALHSRRRQYLVRDLLEQQRRDALERASRAQELEDALTQRTREVTLAQQGLATAQRMAAVGTMASGLAHDINNVLLPLSVRLDQVLETSGLTGEARSNLIVVMALLDHLRQMSRNLSLFARDPLKEGIEGMTNLDSWFKRVQGLMESSLGGAERHAPIRLSMRWDCSQGLPPVAVAPHRLTQMVLNLVHNARDAVMSKHSGREGVQPPLSTITIQARASDDESIVLLKVIDQGIGMNEEARRRSIEPFFTTKDRPIAAGAAGTQRMGSGMGLTLVHAMMERIGGRLDIQSVPGSGTTVTLVLPVVPEPSNHEPPAMRVEIVRNQAVEKV